MCAGDEAFSNILQFLIKAVKDKNDPQLQALVGDVIDSQTGKLKAGHSFTNCTVSENGSLTVSTLKSTGVETRYVFETKGSMFIEFMDGAETSRPANSPPDSIDSGLPCQAESLTLYALAFSEETASYVAKSAELDEKITITSAEGLTTFSDALCKNSTSTFTLAKGSSSVKFWFTVANDKSVIMKAITATLPAPSEKKVFGAAAPMGPTRNPND